MLDYKAIFQVTVGVALAIILVLSGFLVVSCISSNQLRKELIFSREANAYKFEALQYADSCIMATDSLIDELERNNLLPDESENLENFLIYKQKLDSMYATEL